MSHTTTTLHLGFGEQKPIPHVATYPTRSPIASVRIDGNAIEVCATNPADLLLVAEAFNDAARRLADELDKYAAREMNAEQVPA